MLQHQLQQALYTYILSFSSGLCVGSPSQSVCVAGRVYLLWSEGEDYQAVLQRVTRQHAGSTFSVPPQ